MKHRANPKFWRFYAQLPEEIQRLGDQNYDLLNDPNQSLLPSLLLTFLVRHDKSLRLVLPDG